MNNKLENFFDVFKTYITIIAVGLLIIPVYLIYLIGRFGDNVVFKKKLDNELPPTFAYFVDGFAYAFLLLLLCCILIMIFIALLEFVGKIKFFVKINKYPITKSEIERLDFVSAKDYLTYASDKISLRCMLFKEYVNCNYSQELMKCITDICEKKFNKKLRYEIVWNKLILYYRTSTKVYATFLLYKNSEE